MTTIDPNSITAADTFAAAKNNHSKAVNNHDAAEHEFADAKNARDALLKRVESGGMVGTADLRAAGEAISEAEAATMLALAVTRGTKSRRDAAEIPHLAALAADINNNVTAAAVEFVTVCDDLDAEIKRIQTKMGNRGKTPGAAAFFVCVGSEQPDSSYV